LVNEWLRSVINKYGRYTDMQNGSFLTHDESCENIVIYHNLDIRVTTIRPIMDERQFSKITNQKISKLIKKEFENGVEIW